ncbi:Aste57867_23660 [Aphanomyces stellatus]|uniref:Aste57867_23660 protein n=1 Tax=Aphanomyces stellatus TaxID=120398 RepID=A0A485LPD3_9STRA|nr:hypothetical protein As57867_023588 [Aphanomyces stellatus]VFU00305.1 Aste57867_23660 [Aphanomyces stellatus]
MILFHAAAALIAATCVYARSMTKEDVIDTVPAGVTCDKVKHCDEHQVCVLVCERGSVKTEPWVDRALALQRKLAYTHSLCYAQLPGTHNSAINMFDGYGVEDHVFQNLLAYIPWMPPKVSVHTSDQHFSMTDQLRLGARLLELDVHWVDDDLRIAHCGGFESSLLDEMISWLNKIAKMLGMEIQWDSETVGCKPSLSSIPAHSQRHVQDALDELAAWLHRPENAHEFLLVYFDDEVNLLTWHKVPLLLEYIKKAFPVAEIVKPQDVPPAGAWPAFESLVASGKRVAFLTATDYAPVGDELLFLKDSLCKWQEPELPLTPYPICRFPDATHSTLEQPGTLFRPESSEIQYGVLNAMGHVGPNLHLVDDASIPQLLECGAAIPSPDNLTPKRMEAMVWSFAPGEPLSSLDGDMCVAMKKASPRWIGLPCDGVDNMGTLCKHNQTTWVITDSSCHDETEAAVPTNAYENRVVHDVLKTSPFAGVWIPVPKTTLDALYGRGQVYDASIGTLV